MHGWALFFSVFGVIFVAELPDKTALAALVLATRHKPLPVLLGSATALTIQCVVAVAAGQLISLLPMRPVHMVAGGLFIVFAIFMWRRKEEDEDGEGDEGTEKDRRATFLRSLWTTFTVVFIAEWGDLTQLATATLAAQYRAPFIVFAASALALWAVASIAVLIGNRAGRLLDANLTKRIAAVIFVVIGVALLAGLI